MSILINNAGVGLFGKLVDQTPQMMMDQIYANTFPLPVITNILLPRILAWEKSGKKGAVINVASTTGRDLGYQTLSVYSATKAFDIRFSQILNKEYGDKVDVHCVMPSAVNSGMNPNP